MEDHHHELLLAEKICQAQTLIAQGRYDFAVKLIHEHFATDPNDPLGHLLMGMCMLETQQYKKAIESANASIAAQPDFSSPFALLAMARMNLGHMSRAVEAIDEALRLDPNHANHWAARSLIYRNIQKWQKSLDDAERGLAIDANNAECMKSRTIAMIKLGRVDKALAFARETLRNSPENADTFSDMAGVLILAGEYDTGRRLVEESLRINPEDPATRKWLLISMKAQNPIYHFFLSRSILRSGPGDGQPTLSFAAKSVVTLIMMLLIDPIFNLIMCRDAYSRSSMETRYAVGSMVLIVMILTTIGLSIVCNLTEEPTRRLWFVSAFVFGSATIPIVNAIISETVGTLLLLRRLIALAIVVTGIVLICAVWADRASIEKPVSMTYAIVLLGYFAVVCGPQIFEPE